MRVLISLLLLATTQAVAVEEFKTGTLTGWDVYIVDVNGTKAASATFADVIIYWHCFGSGTNTAIDETGDTLTKVSDGHYEVVTNDTITCAGDKTFSSWVTGTISGTAIDPKVRLLKSVTNIASDVETQVDAALDNAIPASPTAGSINDKVRRIR